MPHAHLLCVGGVHDSHEAIKRQLLPQVLQQAVFGLRPEMHVGILWQQRDECCERLLGLEVRIRLAVRKCLPSHQLACQPTRIATARAKSEVSVVVAVSTRTPTHGDCRYTTQTDSWWGCARTDVRGRVPAALQRRWLEGGEGEGECLTRGSHACSATRLCLFTHLSTYPESRRSKGSRTTVATNHSGLPKITSRCRLLVD